MNRLIFGALTAMLFALTPARAQIPVTDIASLSQQVQQVIAWGQQYGQMVQQINNQVEQITHLQATFNSLTGSRGVGAFMNGVAEQGARRYLPADLAQIYDLYSGTAVPGFTALATRISALRNAISTLPAGYFPAGSQLDDELRRTLDSIATQRAIAEQAYRSTTDRIPHVERLMARIDTTNDPKEIAELQARIAAEQVIVQADTNRIAVLQYQQEIQRQQEEQRSRERLSRMAGGVGSIDFSSITPHR